MSCLPECLQATERALDAVWGYAKQAQRREGCVHEWRASVGLIVSLGEIHKALVYLRTSQKIIFKQRDTAGFVKTLAKRMPHPADKIKEVERMKKSILALGSSDWGNTP